MPLPASGSSTLHPKRRCNPFVAAVQAVMMASSREQSGSGRGKRGSQLSNEWERAQREEAVPPGGVRHRFDWQFDPAVSGHPREGEGP
jgi:hypothetical protein